MLKQRTRIGNRHDWRGAAKPQKRTRSCRRAPWRCSPISFTKDGSRASTKLLLSRARRKYGNSCWLCGKLCSRLRLLHLLSLHLRRPGVGRRLRCSKTAATVWAFRLPRRILRSPRLTTRLTEERSVKNLSSPTGSVASFCSSGSCTPLLSRDSLSQIALASPLPLRPCLRPRLAQRLGTARPPRRTQRRESRNHSRLRQTGMTAAIGTMNLRERTRNRTGAYGYPGVTLTMRPEVDAPSEARTNGKTNSSSPPWPRCPQLLVEVAQTCLKRGELLDGARTLKFLWTTGKIRVSVFPEPEEACDKRGAPLGVNKALLFASLQRQPVSIERPHAANLRADVESAAFPYLRVLGELPFSPLLPRDQHASSPLSPPASRLQARGRGGRDERRERLAGALQARLYPAVAALQRLGEEEPLPWVDDKVDKTTSTTPRHSANPGF
ncbi:hypothetical protein NCLIV_046500 [Neospora caninum Liverpool]|uniref:Uncharacterized protein n=1 Tax=Neospora caninum (strain Liverpool) TaxID=572307 RepID=F0VLU0_NEOCL|nr:hypothetical protein NCLIV_046500 [Neospora caninum Liverpool]CBZ54218.1 hypothetical protein NCLIV_046500 [Neospora caninum Liverpool]|eukprot:XP_003884249.1 hypothetical protein NCLIV_046500 [Neospora caninum Liverpool]